MKKTIWIPLVLAVIFGLFVVMVDSAGFIVSFGVNANGEERISDTREIFNTFSAALGGPLAVLVSQVIKWFFNPGLAAFSANYRVGFGFIVHGLAGLWMVFAHKFIYERIKSQVFASLAWIGSLLVYYYLILIPFFAVWIKLMMDSSANIITEYVIIASGTYIEFGFTAVITTLAWLALPKRFHAPLWIESSSAKPPTEKKA
jgi:hypothetical protein